MESTSTKQTCTTGTFYHYWCHYLVWCSCKWWAHSYCHSASCSVCQVKKGPNKLVDDLILISLFSCIFALITTSVDISLLVLSGLTLLAMTHSFQCEDKLTGQSTECRLCGTENPLTGDIYKCNGAKESFHHSLEGFSSSVVWLIFAAFHLGKAVEVTHLGRRVSLLMIKLFGKHIMGLAYAIVISGKHDIQYINSNRLIITPWFFTPSL